MHRRVTDRDPIRDVTLTPPPRGIQTTKTQVCSHSGLLLINSEHLWAYVTQHYETGHLLVPHLQPVGARQPSLRTGNLNVGRQKDCVIRLHTRQHRHTIARDGTVHRPRRVHARPARYA